MSYQQVIVPNLNPVIIVDGQPLPDWLGYCMGYVASALNIFGNRSAHEGWVTAQYKHTDRNLPSGVYVVLWFDYFADLDGTGIKNWGHVVIYKDGTFWSSPKTHKPQADTYTSIEQIERDYGVTYVGWSEDIRGVRIIKQGEDDMVPDRSHLDAIFQQFFGRNSTDGEQAEWIGKKSYTELIDVLLSQQAYKDQVHRADVGFTAIRDNWQGQIETLTKQLAAEALPLAPGKYIVK